ncbi:hypothetical protein [Kocuria sp. HSID16901]|uniref:hypothetical protein n=1 Tax=Kocuria sp. HSID16901 TaxID=2419505 RepID=UPI0006613ED9|nr:hypothetical protein [Kocuria sp. HSID16901]MCT1367734.1 hypothetical protein [Rothia sp. p3-SID1597]
MTQAIQLGSVLGGRYKVTGQIITTAAQDQVLDGKDQVLERKVSILVASPEHSDLLIENARDVATGSRSGSLQVLDLGQSDDITYLITSHTQANDLLDLLLTDHQDNTSSENEELGGEIFGGSDAPTAPSSDYEQVGTETSPQAKLDERNQDSPGVTEWTDADYEAFGEEPPARRSSRGSSRGGSLFDRAATDVAGGAAGASAASWRDADSSYNDDSRYDFDDDFSGSHDAHDEYDSPEHDTYEDEPYEGEYPEDDGQYYDDDDYYDDSEDNRRRGSSIGLWITAIVIIILLLLLVVFGFSRLGKLVSGSESVPSGTVTSASSQSASEASDSSSNSSGASPTIASVSRLVPDRPDFMADQDATLTKTFDGNASSYWTSYGFSSPDFGGLVSGIGLAIKLQEPTKVSQLTVDAPKSTGGQFTVFTNDSPSLDGATNAGQGTFENGKTTVDLSDEAKSKSSQYVMLYITKLPQVSSPIGGYNNGVHIGEIGLK